jgi:protein phosphatase
MGGHAGGALASRIVRDAVVAGAPAGDLEAAVLAAHAAVRATAEGNAELAGMGSTVVAAQLDGGVCRIVWVGDSRAYLWREGSLTRLTRDHSMSEFLQSADDETIAGDLPADRILVQALGRAEPQPSGIPLQIRGGDRILLASDGLSVELDDGELAAVLAQGGDPESTVEALLAGALAKGGRDNVSAILVEFDERDAEAPAVAAEPARRASLLPAVVGGVALGVIAAIVGWFLWMRR